MSNSTRIKSIESILVDIPTIRAHELAMTSVKIQTLVIVRILCDDGIEGIGEATCIGGLSYREQSPEGIKLTIDKYITPIITGKDATNISLTMSYVTKSVRGYSFAKNAVETALLDAHGKRLRLPVYSLLGGALRHSLPVLWTLASGDYDSDVNEARELMDKKLHRMFKLKIGRRDPSVDVAHAIAIKSFLGNEIKVTVDINQAWDEITAKKYIAILESNGIDLIEQPISRRNRKGMSRLTNRFTVPIMADESVNTPEDAFNLACDGAADVFALKIAKSGGLLTTLKTAAVGNAAGIALYGGTMLEGTIGTTASAHVFACCPQLEWGTELFGPLLLKDDIVIETPTYNDYKFHLNESPGLGLSIDVDKLDFYRRDRNKLVMSTAKSPAAALGGAN